MKCFFQGVPVQIIEREFFSAQSRQNYGIYEGCDVYQLLSCLSHHLKISNGMVYSLQNKELPYRPVVGSSLADYQESNNFVSGTCKFLPTGCENNSDIHSQQNGAVKEDNELDGEISDKVGAHIAVAVYDQIGVTDITQNAKENTKEGVLNLIFYYLI
jgi:hypothetical protein